MNRKWKNPGVRTEYDGLYQSWRHMHQRAENKSGKNPTYSDVTICERWNSYDNFFEDMSSTWFKGATLDKDSILPGNRVYCKEYCKWITREENTIERNNRVQPPWKGKFGEDNPHSKKVVCIETGEIFNSTAEAERKLNIFSGGVRHSINPKHSTKSAGGYHWKYVED